MEAVNETSSTILQMADRRFKEVAEGYSSFSENDVLLAKITPCMENGKCAIARGLRNGLGFGSTEFHVVRASQNLLPEWIYYFWRLPNTRALAERNMTGTAGQKRVPTVFFESLTIPVPPIEQQRRIVRTLIKADRLCRIRRYTLQTCEEILPALFLRLFGSPDSNPKGWDVVTIDEVLEWSQYGTSQKSSAVKRGLPDLRDGQYC